MNRPERSEVYLTGQPTGQPTGALQDNQQVIVLLQIINSQILTEIESVCAKSPGIESGRDWRSFAVEMCGVFEVVLLVKKGIGGKIGGNVRGRGCKGLSL